MKILLAVAFIVFYILLAFAAVAIPILVVVALVKFIF